MRVRKRRTKRANCSLNLVNERTRRYESGNFRQFAEFRLTFTADVEYITEVCANSFSLKPYRGDARGGGNGKEGFFPVSCPKETVRHRFAPVCPTPSLREGFFIACPHPKFSSLWAFAHNIILNSHLETALSLCWMGGNFTGGLASYAHDQSVGP